MGFPFVGTVGPPGAPQRCGVVKNTSTRRCSFRSASGSCRGWEAGRLAGVAFFDKARGRIVALAHPARTARTNRFLSMTVSAASAAWQPSSFRHGGGLFWPSSLHVNMYDDAVPETGISPFRSQFRQDRHMRDKDRATSASPGGQPRRDHVFIRFSRLPLAVRQRGSLEPAASLASPSRSTSPSSCVRPLHPDGDRPTPPISRNRK